LELEKEDKKDNDLQKITIADFENDKKCIFLEDNKLRDMNDCELQKYLPDILDNIFNDYFNIKQA
jgi:hypothetical protein